VQQGSSWLATQNCIDVDDPPTSRSPLTLRERERERSKEEEEAAADWPSAGPAPI